MRQRARHFAMKCCTKMPCPLPHNHYCCLLSSPICLPHLLICTCLISSPIACPPSSVLCCCLLRFFIFLIYATFLCDSILDCLCIYFCLIVFLYHFILAVFLLNSIIVSKIYNVNTLSFSLLITVLSLASHIIHLTVVVILSFRVSLHLKWLGCDGFYDASACWLSHMKQ